MKYVVGLLLIVLACSSFYAGYKILFPQVEPQGQVQGETDHAFAVEGTIVAGLKKDALYVEYAQNATITVKELVITNESICAAPNGSQLCIAFSTPLGVVYKDARVTVEGKIEGNAVRVSKLTKIDPTGPSIELRAKLGEEMRGLDIRITPLQVMEDSRCPSSVQCVWAGTVRVKTQIVSGMGTSTTVLTLGEKITTEAEEITLTEVSPSKVTEGEIKKELYVLTYTVKKKNVKY